MVKSIKRGISWIRVECRIRRDIDAVMALDDSMLADIGLRRGEIEHVVRHGRPFATTASEVRWNKS